MAKTGNIQTAISFSVYGHLLNVTADVCLPVKYLSVHLVAKQTKLYLIATELYLGSDNTARYKIHFFSFFSRIPERCRTSGQNKCYK